MLLRSAGFSLVTVSSERRTRLTNELSTQHHFLRNLGRNHDGVTPTHGQQQFKLCSGGGSLTVISPAAMVSNTRKQGNLSG